MSQMEDIQGNPWFKKRKHKYRLNHTVRGAHVVIQFQCEEYWMLNSEGRHPVPKLDDTYI